MLDYGPLRDADESGAFADIVSVCFGSSAADSAAWLERAGPAQVRLLRAEQAVRAGLLLVPMGQNFGGREVATAGIAAVGVPPESRGRGLALELCRATLRELHAAGTPLSTLYPATFALYRLAGYEVAGHRQRVRVFPPALPRQRPALAARPLTAADDAAVEDLARARALRTPGSLLRGDYVRERLRHPRNCEPPRVYGFEQDGRLTGYLRCRQMPGTRPPFTRLLLTDWATVTPQAAQALLVFLARHDSLVEVVEWHGGVHDALTAQLRERHYEVAVGDPWMLRIVHVPAALAARGWPAAKFAPLLVQVSDPDLPANSGCWRLHVTDGVAEVTPAPPGSAPLISTTAQGLAPLYSGLCGAHELAAAGLLSGDERALELAEALFAGPAPSTQEHF